MADFPPGGTLFKTKEKRHPKAPDVFGDLEITRELLVHLVGLAKAGKPIKMRLSGWNRKSPKTGAQFLSLRAEMPDGGRSVSKPAPEKLPFESDSVF